MQTETEKKKTEQKKSTKLTKDTTNLKLNNVTKRDIIPLQKA